MDGSNSKGFIPLLVILAITAVSAGTVAVYQVTKNNPEPNPVKSAVDFVQDTLANNAIETPSPEEQEVAPQDCPKPNTWSIVITQKQINDFLKSKIPDVEYAGYKIENAKVTLGNDRLEAIVSLNNNKALRVQIKLNEKGSNFTIEEIESVGSTPLSPIELSAIKLVLNNASKMIWTYFDDYYEKAFKYVDISTGKVDIFFYTSEYLDCVSK